MLISHLFIVLIATAVKIGPGMVPTTRNVPEDYRFAIARLVAYGADTSVATGFFVAFEGNKYLVTNAHVLESHARLVIRVWVQDALMDAGSKLSSDSSGNWTLKYTSEVYGMVYPQGRYAEITMPLFDSAGVSTWKRHPDRQIDIAAIPIPKPLSQVLIMKAFGLSLFADSSSHQWGNRIVLLGYPQGFIASDSVTCLLREGVVAARRSPESVWLDAPTYPGSSGSPVFIEPSWKLFGIISMYTTHLKMRPPNYVDTSLYPLFFEVSGLGVAFTSKAIEETLRAGI
jgi:V8-like Glu-specific endopeptidase